MKHIILAISLMLSVSAQAQQPRDWENPPVNGSFIGRKTRNRVL